MLHVVKDYNSMSEDNANDSYTENFEKKRRKRFKTYSSFIEENSKKLDGWIKLPFIEKMNDIDPAKLWHAKHNPECSPPIEA